MIALPWLAPWVAAAVLALQTQPPVVPSTEELIAVLDDRTQAWYAATELSRRPGEAARLLLEPGRLQPGPHGQWSGSTLALAKLGPPAIPAMAGRLAEIAASADPALHSQGYPLIDVLASMGPVAVPALVQAAGSSSAPGISGRALDAIIRMEPPTAWFGQVLPPWSFWRPADDVNRELGRQLVPLLPQVASVFDRAPRQTAQLLVRWGNGALRERGLATLREWTQRDDFSYRLAGVRTLHAVGVPALDALKSLPAMVPAGDLRHANLLNIAIALHQAGDPGWVAVVEQPLRAGRSFDRADAAQFIASTGDIAAGVPLLVSGLADATEWNGQTVGQVVHRSLQKLTLQDLPPTADSWQQWLREQGESGLTRRRLIERDLSRLRAFVRTAVLDDARRRIGQLGAVDGTAVLPLVDDYLARSDLNELGIAGTSVFDGAPPVITLLLGLAQRDVPGARDRLVSASAGPPSAVQAFAALALAAFDRPAAVERLATGVGPERYLASDLLLLLGDARGLPLKIDTLTVEFEPMRRFACRDLRVYTQQTFSCAAAAQWRAWWVANPAFTVPLRQATLDVVAGLDVSPIGFGGIAHR